MEKDILQTWFFLQQPGEVWGYLTKPELIAQWLMKNNFEPVVGHKFQFTYGPDKPKITYCEVLEIIPHKLLSYSWKTEMNENHAAVDSVVTWTLTARNGGTELQLRHSGFTLLEDSIAHSKAWNSCVSRMTEFLNSAFNANSKK
jgi:uncharacterized protein YndB with AHSA1/START domain